MSTPNPDDRIARLQRRLQDRVSERVTRRSLAPADAAAISTTSTPARPPAAPAPRVAGASQQPASVNRYLDALARPAVPSAEDGADFGETNHGSGRTWSPVTVGDRLRHAGSRFAQGLTTEVGAGILEGLATLAKDIDLGGEYEGREAEDLATWRAAQRVREWADATFPTDPALRGRFLEDVLPSAFGQVGAFMLGGAAVGAAGGSATAFTAGAGSLLGAGGTYQDARESGADPQLSREAARLGALVGTTEAVPIGKAFGRFERAASGAGAPRHLVAAALGAAEEGVQEGASQLAGNVIARTMYDADRDLMEGVGTAFAAGAIPGAVASGALSGVGAAVARRRERAAATPSPEPSGSPAPFPTATSDDFQAPAAEDPRPAPARAAGRQAFRASVSEALGAAEFRHVTSDYVHVADAPAAPVESTPPALDPSRQALLDHLAVASARVDVTGQNRPASVPAATGFRELHPQDLHARAREVSGRLREAMKAGDDEAVHTWRNVLREIELAAITPRTAVAPIGADQVAAEIAGAEDVAPETPTSREKIRSAVRGIRRVTATRSAPAESTSTPASAPAPRRVTPQVPHGVGGEGTGYVLPGFVGAAHAAKNESHPTQPKKPKGRAQRAVAAALADLPGLDVLRGRGASDADLLALVRRQAKRVRTGGDEGGTWRTGVDRRAPFVEYAQGKRVRGDKLVSMFRDLHGIPQLGQGPAPRGSAIANIDDPERLPTSRWGYRDAEGEWWQSSTSSDREGVNGFHRVQNPATISKLEAWATKKYPSRQPSTEPAAPEPAAEHPPLPGRGGRTSHTEWKKGAVAPHGSGKPTVTFSEEYADGSVVERDVDGSVIRDFPGRSNQVEPPVPAGHVRMYHGGIEDGQTGPLWFSSHRDYAEGYARKAGEGAQLFYVDVPEDHPAFFTDYPEQSVRNGHTVNAELEAELSSQRQLVPGFAPVPAGEPQSARKSPKVQRTLGDLRTEATDDQVRALYDAAVALMPDQLPTTEGELKAWGERVLGVPYSDGTWTLDAVFDAIEGAANTWVRGTLPSLVQYDGNIKERLERLREVEDSIFRSRSNSGEMKALQQFSTPLPIAQAAAFAADVARGERVSEPSAGTGNLVAGLLGAGETADVYVNEIDPRRRAVLAAQGWKNVTGEDALRLQLDGRRYNVVITNPPYGSVKKKGQYSGFEATEFAASDVAQRHFAASLNTLVDGGRIVGVMPRNTITAQATAFRKWLEANHTVVAYIESPESSYRSRGVRGSSVLVVVDKGKVPGLSDQDPIRLLAPGWGEWASAVAQLAGAGPRRRVAGRQEAVDGPTRSAAAVAPAKPLAEAPVVDRNAPAAAPAPDVNPMEAAAAKMVEALTTAITQQIEKATNGSSTTTEPAAPGAVDEGDRAGSPNGRRRAADPEPGEPDAGSRDGVPPGGGRDSEVVAEPAPRDGGARDGAAAPAVVPKLARRRVEPRPGDSKERRREIEAANDSRVFAPYALGDLRTRSPHPRLVVETRSMAGMPAPAPSAKLQSREVKEAWGRDGQKGGISDEQVDAVQRIVSAWERGHGFLLADDVGVGKSREAAAAILEAIARGKKRILYTTKNQSNVIGAGRELNLVATGSEAPGSTPWTFVEVGDYKGASTRQGERTVKLPRPDGVTVYFAHAYNFSDYAESIAEVEPEVWIADEAHEFLNQDSNRGIAWGDLHQSLLDRNGWVAYLSATPGTSLDQLGYLYGLREWPVGGFKDWVDRKIGKAQPTPTKLATLPADARKEFDAWWGNQPPGRYTSRDRSVPDFWIWYEQEGRAAVTRAAGELDRSLGDREGLLEDLRDFDRGRKKGEKKRINLRGRDEYSSRITPAETEQVLRELKGAGKLIARDLWRGGVEFRVDELDFHADSAREIRQRLNTRAELVREILHAGHKFGRMNKKLKTSGLAASQAQAYMQQALFSERLPFVLDRAREALAKGNQVILSIKSVSGDTSSELDEGVAAGDVTDLPANRRLESAINDINTEQVEKVKSGDTTEYVSMGEIPEALLVRDDLLQRAKELPPLPDPLRAIEDAFGADLVAGITGRVSAKKRTDLMAEFQSGKRRVAVISDAGKVGISLHDVNGARRTHIIADYVWDPKLLKQDLGRSDRTGQKSSPEVLLTASSSPGERRFASSIAARMASLGATSKGSAESTGTDALDQFDISDQYSVAAMKDVVSELGNSPYVEYFTSRKFLEWKKLKDGGEELVFKGRPDEVTMKDFLNQMLFFPVDAADQLMAAVVEKREKLLAGEGDASNAARRTARSSGEVLRVTELVEGERPVRLYEVKNEAGEKRGIVQGFVTDHMIAIQQARGTRNGELKSRTYVQFTPSDGGELISGLEVAPAEAGRIRKLFGAGDHRQVGPEEVWDDLRAGEKPEIQGPGGATWSLHLRRDGEIELRPAKGTRPKQVQDALAPVEKKHPGTVGYDRRGFFKVRGDFDALRGFLEFYPPVNQVAAAVDPVADLQEQLRELGDTPLSAGTVIRGNARHGLARKVAGQGASAKAVDNLLRKTDRELIEQAIAAGVLDDETVSSIQEALAPHLARVSNEAGFLRLTPGAEPSSAPAGPGGPRVLVEGRPRSVGPIESYLMPPSRLARRLLRSTRATVREIGSRLHTITEAGQDAHQRFARTLDEKARVIDDYVAPLRKAQREELVELLDTYADAGELPIDTHARVREAFTVLRDGFREDWRRLGRNDRVMLTAASRRILDHALQEWPEGVDAPDFDNTPVNRGNIMEAADRDGGHREPTTREGWEDLVASLKLRGRRVQRAVFMDSPDLRRIYDMIQGRGGIQAYFPHVFTGDWKVSAGDQSKRFVDRMEAVQYARKLLEGGHTEDILVQLDGFTPDGALYTSRAHYQALTRALETALGAESAVVTRAVSEAGRIKVNPRKRFFSHAMKREVNLQTFERDVLAALRIYHYRLARKLAFDPFRRVALEEAEHLPVRGGWRDYGNSYIADVQGVPQEVIQTWNNFFETMTGWIPFKPLRTGPFALQKGASRWQWAMSLWHLGYSPVTAAVNLTQLAINVVPSFERGGHRWLWKGIQELARGGEETRRVIDFMGIDFVHPKYLAGEYLPTGEAEGWTSWLAPMFLFNKSERFNRASTALARYHYLRANGADELQAMQGAREFTIHTNFEYSVTDAPRIMRNPVGKAFFQFKNFTINQLFFAGDLLRHGTNRQRATFTAYLMAFGGLNVLATASPLFLVNWLAGMTGVWEDDRGNSITPWEALWDELGEGGDVSADVLLRGMKYGLLALFGLDFSERVGFGGPREFDTLPGSKLRDVRRWLDAGTATEKEKALRRLLPSSVKRIMDAYDAADEGVVRDSWGRVVDRDVSGLDVAAASVGARTVEQSERSARIGKQIRMIEAYRGDRGDYLDRVVRATAAGDHREARRLVDEARGRGIRITRAQVRASLRDRDLEDVERRALRTPRDLRRDLFTREELAAARAKP